MSPIAQFGLTSTKFTDCSKWQINQILEIKSDCFKELRSFCGNAIIEEGEGSIC